MTLRPGLLDDKYEVLHKLGEGGMGTVYKVRHVLLDDVRVIKVIRQQPSQDEGVARRFHQEARTAIRLRHPGIAQLYDFSVADDGAAVIVMEFIDGVTLFEILKKAGPPKLGLTIEIALQGLDALAYLHEEGYVHRDISPDNLMLTRGRDGRPLVKLIDLGLAKSIDSSLQLTATGTYLGKVRYSAPEQFGDAGVDARSDLYSFGVMLYELLTGVLPISGEQFSELVGGHLVRPPRDFTETDPEDRVPPELRSVVLQTLEKDPARRIASAAELARLLEPFRQPFQSPFEGDANLITPLGVKPSPLDTKAHGEAEEAQAALPPGPPAAMPPAMVTAVTVRTGQPEVAKRVSQPPPSAPAAAEPTPMSDVDATPRRRRLRIAAALAFVVTLVVSGALYMLGPEPGEEEFRAAMLYYRSEQWPEAIKGLRAAIEVASRERPGRLEIETDVMEPYLPHYFLGSAYQESNPVLAWTSLNESRAQGVVQQFEPYRQDLERRLRELTGPTIQRVESELSGAEDLARIVRPILDGEEYAWLRENEPEVVSRARDLLTQLDAAYKELERARTSHDYIAAGDSETHVRDLRRELGELSLDILDLIEELEP